MKHFAIKMLLLSFLCVSITFNASSYETAVISVLKEIPKKSINECTGEDIMNLLPEESVKWIESIECNNISIEGNKAGILINIYKDNSNSSYIRFNFKNTLMLNTFRVVTFGNNIDQSQFPANIYVNDKEYTSGFFGYNSSVSTSKDCADLIKKIRNSSVTIYINGPEIMPLQPLKSIEVNMPSTNTVGKIQFLGFRIFYDGVVDNSDIETAVSELQVEEDEKSVEYFDMMGRRLPEAPAKGIYIRKCGSKVEKLTASSK